MLQHYSPKRYIQSSRDLNKMCMLRHLTNRNLSSSFLFTFYFFLSQLFYKVNCRKKTVSICCLLTIDIFVKIYFQFTKSLGTYFSGFNTCLLLEFPRKGNIVGAAWVLSFFFFLNLKG